MLGAATETPVTICILHKWRFLANKTLNTPQTFKLKRLTKHESKYSIIQPEDCRLLGYRVVYFDM